MCIMLSEIFDSKFKDFEMPSLLTAIPILLFATVGLFLVLYMHHSWGTMSTVMTHSQVGKTHHEGHHAGIMGTVSIVEYCAIPRTGHCTSLCTALCINHIYHCISFRLCCIVIYYVCTTLLLQMVSSCGKLCSFERIIKGLAYYSSVGIDGIATG